MGNCFTLQGTVVGIIKKDGKVLEYRTPLRVQRVLADLEGQHAISETIPVTECLWQDARLVAGRSYYVMPPLTVGKAKSKKKKKEVRFADQQETEGGTGDSVVRVKLLIRRRELQEMLEEGAVSVDRNAVSQVVCDSPYGWKPMLKSIPEGS